jgi:hypothetical protein
MTTCAVHISALDSTDDNKSNTWNAFSHCWKHRYGLCYLWHKLQHRTCSQEPPPGPESQILNVTAALIQVGCVHLGVHISLSNSQLYSPLSPCDQPAHAQLGNRRCKILHIQHHLTSLSQTVSLVPSTARGKPAARHRPANDGFECDISRENRILPWMCGNDDQRRLGAVRL